MRMLAVLFVVASLVYLTGCDNAVNPPAASQMTVPGTISGIVTVDPHTEGTVEGAVVQVYISSNDLAVMHATLSTVVDQTGQFTFDNVPPGQYHVGAWKDIDGNGMLNSGDLSTERVCSGTCCCEVACGCNSQVCPCISVVP